MAKTEGQILKVNSAGFPGWATPAEVAVVLAKGTVTSVATLDIDMSAYYNLYNCIEIKIISARPATNSDLLWLRVSPDAITYNNSGYKWSNLAIAASTSVAANDATETNTTSIQIGGSSSNAATNSLNASVVLNSPNIATQYPNVYFTCARYGTVPSTISAHGTGVLTTAQITKAIRILFSSGNIATMSYKVIGYKN